MWDGRAQAAHGWGWSQLGAVPCSAMQCHTVPCQQAVRVAPASPVQIRADGTSVSQPHFGCILQPHAGRAVTGALAAWMPLQ